MMHLDFSVKNPFFYLFYKYDVLCMSGPVLHFEKLKLSLQDTG